MPPISDGAKKLSQELQAGVYIASNGMPVKEVKIGGAEFMREEGYLRTILGSCVAVVLYDRKKKFGAMAHVMLPYQTDENREWSRYGDKAAAGLLEMCKENDIKKRDLEAHIFGGSVMFPFVELKSNGDIGWKNIQSVEKSLVEVDLPVITRDLSGYGGRRITFDVGTGLCEIFRLKTISSS